MTLCKKEKSGVTSRLAGGIWSTVALAAVVAFAVVLSEEGADYFIECLRIAVLRVLPTSFPFMLIADWYTCHGGADRLPLLGRLFSFAFGLPTCALSAYVCGSLCGFPVGARSAGELYRRGSIDRWDAERLVALSSNPSLAFIIGAVGLGMLNDLYLGLLLLFSVHISGIVCGIIFHKKATYPDISLHKSEQKFDIVSSVRDAGANCVSIISFITAAGILTRLIQNHIGSPAIGAAALALLEVTGGVIFFAADAALTEVMRLSLIAFVLGFGGICVLMQSRALIGSDDISFVPYFFIKLLQGILAAFICAAVALSPII